VNVEVCVCIREDEEELLRQDPRIKKFTRGEAAEKWIDPVRLTNMIDSDNTYDILNILSLLITLFCILEMSLMCDSTNETTSCMLNVIGKICVYTPLLDAYSAW